MQVVTSIVPVFAIIMLGWGARKRGLITDDFLMPANRIVYLISIPAMVFGAISKASFKEQFDAGVVSITILAILIIYIAAYAISRICNIQPSRAGSFILCAGHSNVGYIGLPTAFYYLGEQGLASASIICGFVMVMQNMFSAVTLQLHDKTDKRLRGIMPLFKKLFGNPVILSAGAGILVSILVIPIPPIIQRIIDILGGMAPPMALLLIGASLSMKLVKRYSRMTAGTVAIKLVLLPACAMLLFSQFHVNPVNYLPAIILLCSPPATIVYVMAKEMHNDGDFAAAAISVGTLASSLTFIVWLAVIHHQTLFTL